MNILLFLSQKKAITIAIGKSINIGFVAIQSPAKNPENKINKYVDFEFFIWSILDIFRDNNDKIKKTVPGTSPKTLLPFPYKGANETSRAKLYNDPCLPIDFLSKKYPNNKSDRINTIITDLATITFVQNK